MSQGRKKPLRFDQMSLNVGLIVPSSTLEAQRYHQQAFIPILGVGIMATICSSLSEFICWTLTWHTSCSSRGIRSRKSIDRKRVT